MDLSVASPDWTLLVHTVGPIPDARFTVAGGIYQGTSHLWMSMGETVLGRKLSDTWVLELNTNGDISGM